MFYIIFLLEGKVINIEPYVTKEFRDLSIRAASITASMFGATIQTLDPD